MLDVKMTCENELLSRHVRMNYCLDVCMGTLAMYSIIIISNPTIWT